MRSKAELRVLMNGAAKPKLRLETWKEVAAFFGRTERTVKRWEKERGLPIHRLPGASRSRIYAEISELDIWLKGAPTPETDADGDSEDGAEPFLAIKPLIAPLPQPAPDAPKSKAAAWLRGLTLLLAFVAVVAMAGVLKAHYQPQRLPPPAQAEALYLTGLDAYDDHGTEALDRARDAFTKATQLAPDYAEAYVGLAHTWLQWPDYHPAPARAYAQAEAAARKAIELDARLGSASAVLGLARYYGAYDVKGARKALKRAIELSPENALTLYPYAHFLLLRGQLPEAEAQINHALSLNPSSAAIKADRALILFKRGRKAEATEALRTLAHDEASFATPSQYLGDIYYAQGDDEAALAAWHEAARRFDRTIDQTALEAGQETLKHGGREAALRAMLSVHLKAEARRPYQIAALYAALGQTDQALSYLTKASEHHDPDLIFIGLDPRFAVIESHPAFAAIKGRFIGR
jgi:tetratricopeptide (TPR) repeat protein